VLRPYQAPLEGAAAFHIARQCESGESVWLIHDSEVELAKACGIGDYFDLRNLAIGNSEAEYAREVAGGGQDEPHLAINKRRLYEASLLRDGDGTHPWSSFARRIPRLPGGSAAYSQQIPSRKGASMTSYDAACVGPRVTERVYEEFARELGRLETLAKLRSIRA